MRLFEAIIDANNRALRGDAKAGLHLEEFSSALPVVALTCIDPRLNRFFPGILGLPEDQFIWLRNAGNIITGPLSSTMRSLALACAIKGGREIAIIGHTDCRVRQTTIATLTDRFKALGIERHRLPENLAEYFGIFASEQQNVIRGVDHVRGSPLIGPKIPVHGLMVNVQSGQLDWVVNGYETLERSTAQPPPGIQMPRIGEAVDELASQIGSKVASQVEMKIGEMDFPAEKIGEAAADINKWLSQVKTVTEAIEEKLAPPLPPPQSTQPAPPLRIARPQTEIPVPPRIPLKKKR